ncbi:Two-component system response regulator [Fulvivirga imtechensis AK7]|uniref:Two-component system response regulator n=1 Tax=Fulvivirga imtechensis AK7 TaxID=1237149 RepID=L8JPE0_9BACT|nr:LytTR family DNA-binding domain-containing protein [Fulvivirga imtechensis]ELR70806.1 Two-component system response regulator [Fulvivirga imtechensis AK7]
MKLRTLIIDDEPLAHDVILTYIEDVPFLEVAGQCYLATEAIGILQNREIDLILLDIQMPKLQGLDFLRTLKHPPLVIITSAYEEYALESYDLDVCDYLLKPFRFDRFLKAANKALDRYRGQNQSLSPLPDIAEGNTTNAAKQLFIKSDKRHIQIDQSDIHYLESFGNYVKVWLANEFIITPRTLSSFDDQLTEQFVRIHKSFIVNCRKVTFLEGNMVVLQNKKTLPIGKSHRQAFKKFITDRE